MITLKKITITSNTLKECIALNAPPAQEDYVFSNVMTLALAHDYNVQGIICECRAIYLGTTIIGLISYNYYPNDPNFKEPCYHIPAFMVDTNHINKGYEAMALEELLAEIKTMPQGEASAIFATYHKEDKCMEALFKATAFTIVREDGDNIVLRMSSSPPQPP